MCPSLRANVDMSKLTLSVGAHKSQHVKGFGFMVQGLGLEI